MGQDWQQSAQYKAMHQLLVALLQWLQIIESCQGEALD